MPNRNARTSPPDTDGNVHRHSSWKSQTRTDRASTTHGDRHPVGYAQRHEARQCKQRPRTTRWVSLTQVTLRGKATARDTVLRSHSQSWKPGETPCESRGPAVLGEGVSGSSTSGGCSRSASGSGLLAAQTCSVWAHYTSVESSSARVHTHAHTNAFSVIA